MLNGEIQVEMVKRINDLTGEVNFTHLMEKIQQGEKGKGERWISFYDRTAEGMTHSCYGKEYRGFINRKTFYALINAISLYNERLTERYELIIKEYGYKKDTKQIKWSDYDERTFRSFVRVGNDIGICHLTYK
jgi:hypothetical protein